MLAPVEKPYGAWLSPITADLIVSETIGLGQIALSGDAVYWVEMRPTEGGRNVILGRTRDGEVKEINPAPYNARTRVHEYGGGAYLVAGDSVFFSHFEDQRLYRCRIDDSIEPLTLEGDYRYADAIFDRFRNRLVCVREDHTDKTREPVNTLVSIPLDGNKRISVLASGADFYASPRLSPDGSQLAWLTWNHPNMPWDGTDLWLAPVETAGSLGESKHIAGAADESIFQPEWSPTGTLYFISDRTGWWNLYRWREQQIESVTRMEVEFGVPQWVFGLSTYAFESAERIVCAYSRDGVSHLAIIDAASGVLEELETPYTEIGSLRAQAGYAVFIAASPTEFPAVVQLDLATREVEVLRRASEMSIDSGYLSIPEAIQFPTTAGALSHAFFYPPKNKDFTGLPGERPPLLVISHGGPTAATNNVLSLKIQYWTSRGIAVLDVNYRGSSHYGREYRQQLKGQWGCADVEDCVNGALYLAQRGEVDRERLAIRGSSAGGFTTLAALTFHEVFKAGASYYGVSDLAALAKETHKFESRYLDHLIGPYPERADLYAARSPIHAVDKLSCPVIFFQGLEDKIVPPEQAEQMVEALREKGVPVAYVPFEGEQHGFRRAENIKRALGAELYFYAQIFGFDLAERIEPVAIENL
ncbi:Peptidase S9, prolyl oligopeptidase active site region [Nitrosococcus oceani ATCC 19707]|uniref:Peptidase S9, prolyl oligopeptidase active site region n=2 Tax=Nitrosococcus oceani TaxID=1229 RepID=Q3JBY6_NITOC|nr:S9 family peptidase [Nitrosococcus oceani]ABA57660.1 Peptidase S9, prolyl oligopeptidase active site region [Nitrosococcus oceani ATCC 19707]EDZ67734.1 peptidase, S9A/B/C family, catalytic domain protein [Nitrosococcus oceani AFC27]KFI19947.1 peptidase [Nitrosococcus oceani C-27]GEM19301.1 peptidase [Nitrosococcus oceani]